MVVEFEIRREDYMQATRAHGAQAKANRYGRVVPYALCALGFFLLVNRNEDRTWVAPAVLICVGVGTEAARISKAYDSVERAWQDAASLIRPVKLQTTPDGLRFSTAHSDSEVQWIGFDHFIETRDLFLLYRTRSQVSNYIPKRCFVSPTQLIEFRSLLHEKIPPPSKGTGGFPVIAKPTPSDDSET